MQCFKPFSENRKEQRQGPAYSQVQRLIRQQYEQEIASPPQARPAATPAVPGTTEAPNHAAAPASDERMTSATAVRNVLRSIVPNIGGAALAPAMATTMAVMIRAAPIPISP